MTKTESYFMARLEELHQLADRGDPWVFLCASSYIEYLAKMVNGKPTRAKDYKNFLREYFFKVCPEYEEFQYASGQKDLANQMYHVLRCGIVHSFSLIADPSARSQGGRDRSIMLAHERNNARHLTPYVNSRRTPKIDAVIFTAEAFVRDIEKVTESIFAKSRKRTSEGKRLRRNIDAWIALHPPIAGRFKLKAS